MSTVDFAALHDPARRRHFVYRAYDAAGQLLYVGMTIDLDRRRREHKTNRIWFDQAVRFRIAGPYNYQSARRIERQAINSERPVHNHDEPERWRRRVERSRYVNRESDRLIAAGMHWRRAVEIADHAYEKQKAS